MTLQEAIAIIEADDDLAVENILIEPPAVAVNSDEDSTNEDEGHLLDNLTGRQLLSQSEIVLPNQRRIGSFNYDEKEGTYRLPKRRTIFN